MKYFAFLFLAIFIFFSPLSATVIENDYLSIHVSERGAITFVDKNTGINWGSNFTGWAYLSDGNIKDKISLNSAEFSAQAYGDSIYFVFSNIRGSQLQDQTFEMNGSIVLEDDKFELEIIDVKTKYLLEDVEYPAHILSVRSGIEDGYIAVPHLQGILIPSRYDAGFMRYGQNIWDLIADQEAWWSFESGSLNMPWFGANIGGSSVMATAITASDLVLHLIGNSVVGTTGSPVEAGQGQNPGTRMSSLSPIWKASKKKWSYARKLRIELVENGYVGMARRYKEYAKASGRYVTLKEKIERNPEYQKLIGAPDIKIYCYTNRIDNPYFRAWSEPVLNGYSKVNTSFDQVAEIADDLEEMGVEKCMMLLAGWNRMGYDREHVDMWPPAEEAGGIPALRKACENVKSKGYLFALHDNYDDFYPDAPSYDPKYIIKEHDGKLHLGGVWDGGLSQIICPSQRAQFLNRNMALVQENIPLNAYYFDVITNTSHYECYDQEHPITRKEDLAYRINLLQNIANRGIVIGGERGTDWAMPIVGFCEGLSGGGADYHRGIGYRIGLTAPLFYLVYRECVVGYWQHGTPHGREDHANHVLLDLLNGQPSSWSIEYDQWEDLKPVFKDVYDLLGRLHQQTAHQAMTDHQVLTKDYMVQKSEFEGGTEIWVNFGITSFEGNNFSIPPKGFRISDANGSLKEGVVSRRIEYSSN